MANDNKRRFVYERGVVPSVAWGVLAMRGRDGEDGVNPSSAVSPSRAYLSLVREQEQKRGGAVKE